MTKLEYIVRFTTPAFLGNAEQQAQWRTPPFKALIRQWWRVAETAGRRPVTADIYRREGELFGQAADEGTNRAGRDWLRQQKGGLIMHPLIETHREALRALAKRYGVTNLRVFGSMARGDADENSDVDLLVLPLPGTSLLDLGGLLMDAQDLLGQRVDVVSERALHPRIRERVLREAQPV